MERFGISTALLTPFTDVGEIDWSLLSKHACSVLADGANSVTLFGTTGEGASVSSLERRKGVKTLIGTGCDADNIILGICANSIGDAVEQINHGFQLGVRSFLLLPPFYFKDCTDTGLADWHQQVFALTNAETRFILYHIPQVSGVGLSLDLVERLSAIAPERVQAIKDSSGDWNNAKSLLTQNAVPVLIGDERLLHRAIAIGASGAISGMANLYPARMQEIVKSAIEDTALSDEVSRLVSVPVIAALKTIHAARTGESAWERIRPPLTRLDANARSTILCTDHRAA